MTAIVAALTHFESSHTQRRSTIGSSRKLTDRLPSHLFSRESRVSAGAASRLYDQGQDDDSDMSLRLKQATFCTGRSSLEHHKMEIGDPNQLCLHIFLNPD